MTKEQVAVVSVEEEQCVNCHACITACPVKYCNDGSGDAVSINADLCIGCGNCITACTHDARRPMDDWDAFLRDVERGVPMVAIVAPAVASNFPDRYLQLNGWLASLGVKAAFDVSFGAELTVKSYLEHVKTNAPKTVIAQPCPAIVSYVETYRPELLPHLAPADSPMLHTIKMVQEFYPEYKDYKSVVISPCLAKKREFVETGLGDYNVTYRAIENYLAEKRVNLGAFPAMEYANHPAERAVLFSTPGGLMRTAEREFPGISNVTRKIEGVHTIYDYLDHLPKMLESGKHPLLIDCLNCEMGCNGGPGTLNQEKSCDEIEYEIEKRNQEMQARHREGKRSLFSRKSDLEKSVEMHWKPNLYGRTYIDRSANNTIEHPAPATLQRVYEQMHKRSEKDFYNCSSCGYGSCEKMAVAIHNGLNVPENCHFYKHSMVDEQLGSIRKSEEGLQQESEKLKMIIRNVVGIMDEITEVSQLTEQYLGLLGTIKADIDHNDSEIEVVVAAAQRGSRDAQESTETLAKMERVITAVTGDVSTIEQHSDQAYSVATKGVDVVERTVEGMAHISESVRSVAAQIDHLGSRSNKIGEIVTVIEGISSQTNMLALNAAVEAARAGEHGRGFAVVADEVKKLAEKSREATQEISLIIAEIQEGTDHAVTAMQRGSEQVERGSELTAAASGSLQEIIGAVRQIVEQVSHISKAATAMSASSNDVVQSVDDIAALSQTNERELESVQQTSSRAVGLMRDIQGISEKNKRAIASIEERYNAIKALVENIEQ